MNPNKKAAIVNAALAMLNHKIVPAIFDYQFRKYLQFSGTLTSNSINLYDHERSGHLAGNINQQANNLFDYPTRKFIQLKRSNENKFEGYDYELGYHFIININGNHIQFFDYQDNSWSNFTFLA